MQIKLHKLNGEPYIGKLVSTVRGQASENLPLKDGKALEAEPTHLIFPAGIRYVDWGSIDLLAAKADGAENVLRVKAASQGFRREISLSVITDDGSYYSFNVKYADDPVKLSVEMADFLHGWNTENKPGNEIPVYLSDLGNESPYLVRLIMKSVHRNNCTKIRHIGSRNFGVQYLLKRDILPQ